MADLVSGVSSRSAGSAGLTTATARRPAKTFAGLLAVIAIGLIVEGLLLRTLTSRTVERWGVQQEPA